MLPPVPAPLSKNNSYLCKHKSVQVALKSLSSFTRSLSVLIQQTLHSSQGRCSRIGSPEGADQESWHQSDENPTWPIFMLQQI